MTHLPSSPETAYATLNDWLNEVENYGLRAERIPPGAYPWISEAWRLGAASVGLAPCLDLTTRYRKALEQIAGRVPQKHPLYFRIVCPACQWKSVEPHTEARHAPNCAGEVARAALASPDTSTLLTSDRNSK